MAATQLTLNHITLIDNDGMTVQTDMALSFVKARIGKHEVEFKRYPGKDGPWTTKIMGGVEPMQNRMKLFMRDNKQPYLFESHGYQEHELGLVKGFGRTDDGATFQLQRLPVEEQTGIFQLVDGSPLLVREIPLDQVWVRTDVEAGCGEFWYALSVAPERWDEEDKLAWQWSKQESLYFLPSDGALVLKPILELYSDGAKLDAILDQLSTYWESEYPEI